VHDNVAHRVHRAPRPRSGRALPGAARVLRGFGGGRAAGVPLSPAGRAHRPAPRSARIIRHPPEGSPTGPPGLRSGVNSSRDSESLRLNRQRLCIPESSRPNHQSPRDPVPPDRSNIRDFVDMNADQEIVPNIMEQESARQPQVADCTGFITRHNEHFQLAFVLIRGP